MVNSLKTKMVLMVGLPLLLVSFVSLYISASNQQKTALNQAEDLSLAMNREHCIELQSLLDTALNSANQAAELFRNIHDQDTPLDMGRESASIILKGLLGDEQKFVGVFSVWEPDAFDMMDVAYGGLPGNSNEGRFSPYWVNQISKCPTLEAIPDEEINRGDNWYHQFSRHPEPCLIWNPGSQLPGDSRRVLRAMAPIINNGEFLGVVGIDIEDKVLDTMVGAWSDPNNEITVHLLTSQGAIVAPSLFECKYHGELNHREIKAEGVFWESDLLVVSQKVESSLAASNLIVALEMPRQVLLGPIYKKLQERLLAGFLLITSALLVVGFFIKINLARLENLGIFTRQVALGEDVEYVVDHSNDEIGNLTRDFHSMLHSLRKSEDERKENLTRLEAILDSVQAGIVIIDPENRVIIDANPAALKMMGNTKEHVINKVCHQFICPEAQDCCPILDYGQSLDGERKILLKSDGSALTIFKTVVTIDLMGKPYLLETFVDVDQQVKAEEALSERLAQISQAKKQQDILVSHAGSREERMVALKTEVNELREQLDLPLRYKAPGEIETWKQQLALSKNRERHEV